MCRLILLSVLLGQSNMFRSLLLSVLLGQSGISTDASSIFQTSRKLAGGGTVDLSSGDLVEQYSTCKS
jgi:hypothetical protein